MYSGSPSLLEADEPNNSYIQRRNIEALNDHGYISYSCEFQYITKDEYETLATMMEQMSFSAAEIYKQGYTAAELDAKNRADIEYMSMMVQVPLDM